MVEGNSEMFLRETPHCQNKHGGDSRCYDLADSGTARPEQVDEPFLNQMKYGPVWVLRETWDVNEMSHNNIKGILISLFGDFWCPDVIISIVCQSTNDRKYGSETNEKIINKPSFLIL